MIRKNLKIDVVTSLRCKLGEGPLWDYRQGLICWIDILKGEIHEYSPLANLSRTIAVRQTIGCIGLYDNENFIGAAADGFVFISRASGQLKNIGDPEADKGNNRFNDGKCDPAGRFFAGSMSLTGSMSSGCLYVLEADLSFRKVIEPVSVSNGMAWSPDGRYFYYIDTPTRQIVAFEYNLENGEIRNGKAIIEIASSDGLPDGMTIDNEGMLWIAHWDGSKISRWDPENGRLLLEISFPVPRITSCTFGGDRLQDLYVTSAYAGLTNKQMKKYPLSGALFIIKDIGYTGIKSFEFRRK